MTIPRSTINEVAPDVTLAAQGKEGFKNPFISFQSLESLCQGETLEYCLKEVAMYSLRYAETVCRFQQIILKGQESNENEERKEIESLRSVVHDSTVGAINALIRVLKNAGKDTKWATNIVSGGRPSYSKFAVLLAFEIVLRKL